MILPLLFLPAVLTFRPRGLVDYSDVCHIVQVLSLIAYFSLLTELDHIRLKEIRRIQIWRTQLQLLRDDKVKELFLDHQMLSKMLDLLLVL